MQDSLKCNISRKKRKNEVYFWHLKSILEKHLNFLQVDFIILCVSSQAYQKYPKYKVCNISRKAWTINFLFYVQINTKVFYKVVVSFWMCITRLVQSNKNNKITSLQYLWKQDEWSWFFACRITSNISSNWYHHFKCVWPGMPKLPKITIFPFLFNVLRKK